MFFPLPVFFIKKKLVCVCVCAKLRVCVCVLGWVGGGAVRAYVCVWGMGGACACACVRACVRRVCVCVTAKRVNALRLRHAQ